MSTRIAYVYEGDITSRTADPIFAIHTLSALVKLGHDTVLIHPRTRGASSEVIDRLRAACEDAGTTCTFSVVLLPRPTLFGRGARSFGYLAALWARSHATDLVWSRHAHAAEAAAVLRIPSIFEHFSALGPRQLRAARRMARRSAFRGFVANSAAHKRLLTAAGLPPQKTVVEHGGVDLGTFEIRSSVAELGVPSEFMTPSRIVYAGSFYPGRGLDTLLTVAAHLPDVAFWLIGGSDQAVSVHRERARELGLSNVWLPGRVPHAKVPLFLSSANVLVAPYTDQTETIDGSRSIEYASPLKLIEYMAAGRSIVTSDIGAIPELLRHEQSALLVPPGDADALLAAIRRLLEDRPLAERLGAAARRQATQHSWEARVARVMEFSMGDA